MVETGKPPESGEAREAGISPSVDAWEGVEGVEEIAQAVLWEATWRVSAPLVAAGDQLYRELCLLMEEAFTPEGYLVAQELLERMRNVGYAAQHLASELALRIVPQLSVVDLESHLQEVFNAANLGTVESVDDFVKGSLLNEVTYVRQVLPEFPADWYKHDWAVTRLTERIAEARARRAGETTS